MPHFCSSDCEAFQVLRKRNCGTSSVCAGKASSQQSEVETVRLTADRPQHDAKVSGSRVPAIDRHSLTRWTVSSDAVHHVVRSRSLQRPAIATSASKLSTCRPPAGTFIIPKRA